MLSKDVIFRDNLNGADTEFNDKFILQAICLRGSCSLIFNGKNYIFSKGDLVIIRRCDLISEICPSDDFKVEAIYLSTSITTVSLPASNYAATCQMSLFRNPVLHLNKTQQMVYLQDYNLLKTRVENFSHNFQHETVINAIHMLILDIYDFHVNINNSDNAVSAQGSDIMNRFLELLDKGEYRNSRDVSHFADKLFITPKYLSEVSKQITGYPANYWITNYTIRDIANVMRDKSLSIDDIVDLFNFSTKAYFSRYVQRYIGVTPTELRN